MGDRTRVRLTVCQEHFEEVREITSPDSFESASIGLPHRQPLMVLTFDDVNYGELPCLDFLEKRGIAYDSLWDAGGTYDAGGDYCRFTSDGTKITKQLEDADLSLSVEILNKLLKYPNTLQSYIATAYQKIYIPDWENQVEYGKKYLALQLISSED